MDQANAKWAVVGLLVASIAVAIVMLATDDVLWDNSPSHAYAVVLFIVAFAVLAGIVLWRPRLGATLTMAWSGLLLVAMALDPLTANVTDQFTGQPVFGGRTTQEALVFLWTEQAYFTFPILFGLVVLTLLFAWRLRSATGG